MADRALPLVRRGRRNARYTAISNEIIDHPTLSTEARITLIYLLSKPDDWQLQIGDLRRLLGTGDQVCGRNKTYEVLRELKASAYVLAVEELLNGRYHRLAYYVFDEPIVDPEGFKAELRTCVGAEARGGESGGDANPKSPRPENREPIVPTPAAPRPEFRETVDPPRPDSPHPENRDSTKDGKKQITEPPPPSPERCGGGGAEVGGADGVVVEFSELWEAWPQAARPRERGYAESLFLRLTPRDRRQAVAWATSYRIMQAHRGGFAAMILFLRDRLFAEFDGGPDVDPEGYFVIKPRREEWGSWVEHYRGRHSAAVMATTERAGLLLTRTRWPPTDLAKAS
jgi:hypothetical protein